MAVPQKGRCLIPTVWCGESDSLPPPSYQNNVRYTRLGGRYECLKKGIGVGTVISKSYPAGSLQNIKYIGEKHEASFFKHKIKTTSQLISKVNTSTSSQNKKLLENVLTKSDGNVDYKAYNSVIVFLFERGIPEKLLPLCYVIR